MLVLSNARRLNRVLKSSTLLSSNLQIFTSSNTSPHHQWQLRNTLPSHSLFSGTVQGNCLETSRQQMYSMTRSSAWFSLQASSVESTAPDTVKELYDKILESVNVKRTMPPNAWLWSLIGNCKNHDDIKLLFNILQNLCRFRLLNLRIHKNFNCNLCREVTNACVRVGALLFAESNPRMKITLLFAGKRALWKHNTYGLSPTIASAHHLLSYAKDHKDAKLMVEVMKLLKSNDLPLQPDEWELISKYSKRFVKAGVKLRKTTFDTWMDFAAKRGDTESLWQIEKLRSESMNQHTLVSGLACAKGFLLEREPNEAAAIIQVLNQTLLDAKKLDFIVELQKLVNEWPLDVIKHRKEEDRKALATALKFDISAMVTCLLNMGLQVSVNLEDLAREESIPS